eukprot:Hpha_TRINITY_DN16251_c0_g2::TRINITY_DN16251_c0_g2_i1::g.13185::m.13185
MLDTTANMNMNTQIATTHHNINAQMITQPTLMQVSCLPKATALSVMPVFLGGQQPLTSLSMPQAASQVVCHAIATAQPTIEPNPEVRGISTDAQSVSPKTTHRAPILSCKVVNAVHVSMNADVVALEREIENFLGVVVIRSVPAWGKATLLVELDREVLLPSGRVTMPGGPIELLASRKDEVVAVPPSEVLNVRFFALDPSTDYEGSEAEIEAYRRALKDVSKLGKDIKRELGKVMKVCGREPWKKVVAPLQPQRVSVSEDGSELLFVQLYFRYEDIDTATSAAAWSDGTVHTVRGLKFVIRNEFSRAGRAPRSVGSGSG